jgi:hypothetical protein
MESLFVKFDVHRSLIYTVFSHFLKCLCFFQQLARRPSPRGYERVEDDQQFSTPLFVVGEKVFQVDRPFYALRQAWTTLSVVLG